MAKDKMKKKAAKAAARAARIADQLREKLEKDRLDDYASALIDRVMRALDDLRVYTQGLADQPAPETDEALPPPPDAAP